jgi:hypothetical protein
MKYAALITKSVTIPGDERSRTNPGHGYPEHTVEHIEIVDFKDKAAMEAWVQRATTGYSKPSFRLIQYEDLKYETEITVKVSP